MKSGSNQIIYVGKAKSLRKRVGSYFANSTQHSHKTKQLVDVIRTFDVITTENEHQAFLLENTYIKKHQPKYNILLRDDKTYPFIFQSKHQFPRFSFYRGKLSRSGKHWGPFTNILAVKDTLDVLQKAFKLRNCPDSFFSNRSRPCLQYQIKRCSAPCVGMVDEAFYNTQVKSAQLFLQGKSKHVMQMLEDKMQTHSKLRQYEQAGIIRDQIRQINSIIPQRTTSATQKSYDILALANSGFRLSYCWVCVENDQVKSVDRHEFEMIGDKSVQEYLEQLIIQRYENTQKKQASIYTSPTLDEPEKIQQYIHKALDIDIKWEKTAEKWSNFAKNIVRNQLKIPCYKKPNQRFFQSLQETFNLRRLPERIECIDISHHQGVHTKASCVAMDSSGMNTALYRLFNLKPKQPGDDYEAIHMTVERHYRRLKNEDNLPDLVIIDGGKGQLKQALLALESLDLETLPLLSIAKGPTRKIEHERYFYVDNNTIVEISLPDAIKCQLQVIRDEAHRFAIQAHRRSHIKSLTMSQLDAIPKLGPKRKQNLLSHFKRIEDIANATIEQIASVPNISVNLAKTIKQILDVEP